MKKTLSVFLAFLMLVLCGCGASAASTESTNKPAPQTTAQQTGTVQKTEPENAAEQQTAAAEETEPEPAASAEAEAASGILVLYFSRTGEQYHVGVIEKGNTAIVAEMIAEQTGADLFEIFPADDHYPMTYDALTDVAKQEQNDRARPAYQGELPDIGAYDTIFIGAPVWWGDWPMILYTVFESHDFSQKTLVPFCTHEGSGLSGFDRKLQNACPGAVILKGLAVRGSDAQNNPEKTREAILGWLKEFGL